MNKFNIALNIAFFDIDLAIVISLHTFQLICFYILSYTSLHFIKYIVNFFRYMKENNKSKYEENAFLILIFFMSLSPK
ncbi:hypothetical protein CBU03nite_28720 [Clostridium butyricum]|nr:hypothetical protein Cbu04g_31440 [Clostridium butyricum]GEQ19279.1 hypothetical protein CBU01nite_39150 [Clostridium butyricum]GEQ26449.1 hypothetical protein CBU03nite_28720 [Clostridium butyricum]